MAYATKRRHKKQKKWITAIRAAQTTYRKTGSLKKARQSLKHQALTNARRLFGAIGEKL
jgi:hypothetical protein